MFWKEVLILEEVDGRVVESGWVKFMAQEPVEARNE
jgi:hypothetical protein